MVAYQPSPETLKYVRGEAGMTQSRLASLVGVAGTQMWRWENGDIGGQIPHDLWQRVEHMLALGSEPEVPLTEDPVVYVLAQLDDLGPDWITDQESSVPVLLDGGLAMATAHAVNGFGFAVHAVPVRFSFLEQQIIEPGMGIHPFHADAESDGTAGYEYIAKSAALLDTLASVLRGWLLRWHRAGTEAAA
jgi:transcriptional regulator with XRE-family HTH domain